MHLKEKIHDSLLETFKKKDGTINYSKASIKIGLSRQSIMNWVKDDMNVYQIQIDNLLKLAKATNRKPEWYLSEIDKQQEQINSHNFQKEYYISLKAQEMLDNIDRALKNNEITDEISMDIIGYLNIKIPHQ